ncbi:class I SAM-dependent methyltransferase [Aminobacter sp. Piv2-1]|uniref:class I SAM-dependent methyltransferase n=1 Tax=Aminobacter sp. Piv2-1 TaxID=3031122 RepID=UPI0030A13283
MAASTRAVPSSLRSVPIYDESAKRIADVYESTTFERVHAGIIDLLPSPGASVLDVGSGSGRDAAALAARGYRVTAVEPSHGLREEAKRRHGDANIEWLDDALPDLHILGERRFAFILVSAVWMHLVSRDRLAAMRRLSQLLEAGGRLAISIRRGPVDRSRAFATVTTDAVEASALKSGLRLVRKFEAKDALARADIAWSTLALEKDAR